MIENLEQATRLYKREKRSAIARLIISALLVIAGITIMVVPVVATFQNNNRLANQINNFQNSVSELPQEVNDARLVAARQYNDDLAQNPFTPPSIGTEDTDPGFAAYTKLLSEKPNDPMAQIVIPTIDVNLPVYHGSSQDVLKKGAGHLYGTALPVGGYKPHQTITTAISGHTGLVSASMFDNLGKLKIGESAYIRTRGTTLRYVMRDSKIVEPSSTDAIHTEPGKDLLQLITCTPYNINTKRIIVTLERAPMPDPAPDITTTKNPYGPAGWQWWMTVTSTLALFFLLLFLLCLWSVTRRLRKARKIVNRFK